MNCRDVTRGGVGGRQYAVGSMQYAVGGRQYAVCSMLSALSGLY
jgi:hypothetical protein